MASIEWGLENHTVYTRAATVGRAWGWESGSWDPGPAPPLGVPSRDPKQVSVTAPFRFLSSLLFIMLWEKNTP